MHLLYYKWLFLLLEWFAEIYWAETRPKVKLYTGGIRTNTGGQQHWATLMCDQRSEEQFMAGKILQYTVRVRGHQRGPPTLGEVISNKTVVTWGDMTDTCVSSQRPCSEWHQKPRRDTPYLNMFTPWLSLFTPVTKEGGQQKYTSIGLRLLLRNGQDFLS